MPFHGECLREQGVEAADDAVAAAVHAHQHHIGPVGDDLGAVLPRLHRGRVEGPLFDLVVDPGLEPESPP